MISTNGRFVNAQAGTILASRIIPSSGKYNVSFYVNYADIQIGTDLEVTISGQPDQIFLIHNQSNLFGNVPGQFQISFGELSLSTNDIISVTVVGVSGAFGNIASTIISYKV